MMMVVNVCVCIGEAFNKAFSSLSVYVFMITLLVGMVDLTGAKKEEKKVTYTHKFLKDYQMFELLIWKKQHDFLCIFPIAVACWLVHREKAFMEIIMLFLLLLAMMMMMMRKLLKC